MTPALTYAACAAALLALAEWARRWLNRRDLAAMQESDRRIRALRAANRPTPRTHPRRRVVQIRTADRALAERRQTLFRD